MAEAKAYGRLTPDANAREVIRVVIFPRRLPIFQFPLLHVGAIPDDHLVGDAVGGGGLAGL